ncbi:MAG: DUF1559 domain-containing protein [Phycisphaera sp.]|nr:DUF1559 domain-containing protein [Phycisphaera sp.]
MNENPIHILSPQDQSALDALMEVGFNADAVRAEDAQHGERAQRLVALLGTLNALPDEDAGDLLVERTLQSIRQHRYDDHVAQPDEMHVSGGGLPFKLPELIAVAAMLMICLSILWPILAHARATARQIACQANLAQVGLGLTAYARDNNDQMPATRARLGDPWWNVGSTSRDGYAQSNSAHLFTLVRNGYATLGDLHCPENQSETLAYTDGMTDWPDARHTSYSYQNQYTKDRPRFDKGDTMAVLSDKNPFFRPGSAEKFDMALKPSRNSNNHALLGRFENGRNVGGQNVLLTNGSVTWMDTPILHKQQNTDNIFHAGSTGQDYYTGLEGPSDRNDSFLVP